jgi:hypothetical protein
MAGRRPRIRRLDPLEWLSTCPLGAPRCSPASSAGKQTVNVEHGEKGLSSALLLSEVCGHLHREYPVVAIWDGDGGDGARKVQGCTAGGSFSRSPCHQGRRAGYI